MISQADLKVIQEVFGKTQEELSGALNSEEEVSLGLRLNGKVYTPEEIEQKTRANQDAYIEIGYKKIAKEAGIDISDGGKNPENIVQKIKEGVTSSLEEKYKNPAPSEELQSAIEKAVQWENKFKTLNQTYEKTTKELEEASKKFEGLQKDIKVRERNNKILASFPEKMKMDKNDALLIINNTLEFEESDEGIIVKRDGVQQLNAVGETEKLENIVLGIIEEKGWTKPSGTGGTDRKGGNGLPSGLSNDDAIKYIIEKGKEPMSTEGSKMFLELTKK